MQCRAATCGALQDDGLCSYGEVFDQAESFVGCRCNATAATCGDPQKCDLYAGNRALQSLVPHQTSTVFFETCRYLCTLNVQNA